MYGLRNVISYIVTAQETISLLLIPIGTRDGALCSTTVLLRRKVNLSLCRIWVKRTGLLPVRGALLLTSHQPAHSSTLPLRLFLVMPVGALCMVEWYCVSMSTRPRMPMETSSLWADVLLPLVLRLPVPTTTFSLMPRLPSMRLRKFWNSILPYIQHSVRPLPISVSRVAFSSGMRMPTAWTSATSSSRRIPKANGNTSLMWLIRISISISMVKIFERASI